MFLRPTPQNCDNVTQTKNIPKLMSSVTLLPSKVSNLHFYSEGQTVSYFGVCGIVVHAVACRKPSSVRRYILQHPFQLSHVVMGR